MNMTYEKFVMYLSTIPEAFEDDNESETNSDLDVPKATGSFNLFDFDQRKN